MRAEWRTASDAAAALEVSPGSTPEVLKDLPGRRVVVRYGNLVVKAFNPSETEAWKRESSALQCTVDLDLAVPFLGSGHNWVATEWVSSALPPGHSEDPAMHRALGVALAKLHAVDARSMPAWPISERLRARITEPPRNCPTELLYGIERLIRPWLPLLRSDTFVHGDWGTSNVLVTAGSDTGITTILDFEDAHLGDAAEDFRWQGLAGPESPQLPSMLAGYRVAGADLGVNAWERIAIATVELCLDVLDWEFGGSRTQTLRLHNRAVRTLQAIVEGWKPGGL